MANVKITELVELSEAPNASDVVPIVDVSASQTKKLTFTSLFSYITGAISGLLTSNLTASRALVSDSSGKITQSSVTSTELGYVGGVTSALQTQLDARPTGPVVNLIYNGNMDLWDRGTSLTPADDAYVLPGWNFVKSAGSETVTQGNSGSTPVPPDGSRYYARVDLIGGGQYAGLLHFMEAGDVIPLRGKTVSLSFQAKRIDLPTFKVAILVWTGTADSITSDVVSSWGATPTLAAGWAYETGPTTVSLTGVFATYEIENIALDTAGMNNLALFFWAEGAAAVDDGFDLTQVQLQIGSVCTPFVPRQTPLERKMAYRRYLRMTGDASGNGPAIAAVATAGSQVFRNFMPFPVEMLRSPTTAVGGTWNNTNCTGPTLTKTSPHGSCLTITSSASGAVASETNSASGDYLEFDAEL